jgi:hypothetical protein
MGRYPTLGSLPPKRTQPFQAAPLETIEIPPYGSVTEATDPRTVLLGEVLTPHPNCHHSPSHLRMRVLESFPIQCRYLCL